ncbi:MAG: hypothetical protein IPJ88_09325 [Myxococcales bacterium]|nr:MAG: hypothetical protein IPJ88_09325 [Myxococcales bacterium]
MHGLAKATVFALLLVACGGGSANIKSGPMPKGGSFEGVWFSPQYGRLDLRQTGQIVIGEYTKDERLGRIQGRVAGNVLRFQWTEKRELIQGMPRETQGRGYFVYLIDTDGDHKLQGEWGHDSEEKGGGPWNAVKSMKLHPRLSSEDHPEDNAVGQEGVEDESVTEALSDDKEPKTESKKAPKKEEEKQPKQGPKGFDNIDDLSDL